MPQEKNILVNRGIPRKPSSSSGFGFGAGGVSNPDHSDRGYDLMDSATDWLIDNNAYTEELFSENIKNIIHITDAELAKQERPLLLWYPLEPTLSRLNYGRLSYNFSKPGQIIKNT